MELQDDILTAEYETLITYEEESLMLLLGEKLAEFVWTPIEELAFSEIVWADLVYENVEETEAKRIKALLREMRLHMLKPIGSIKKLKRLLFSHISLLFGLCSSQSSLIINAYFGNSLSRIPSL